MNVLTRALGLLSVIAIFGTAGAVASAETVLVPQGTDVPLVFDQALSSKTARVGQRIRLHVAQNITPDGATILRAGTPVTGVISRVEKRKRYGINARMAITLNPVRSISGQLIPLEPKTKGKYTGSRTDQAAYAAGGGALLLGPIGLLGGLFVVGKPVNVKPGDPLVSQVTHDTRLVLR